MGIAGLGSLIGAVGLGFDGRASPRVSHALSCAGIAPVLQVVMEPLAMAVEPLLALDGEAAAEEGLSERLRWLVPWLSPLDHLAGLLDLLG